MRSLFRCSNWLTDQKPVRWLLIAFALCGASHAANAQVMLLGCTASITGQPQTTSRLVDVNVFTGVASNPRDTGVYALCGIATQPGTGALFGLASNFSTQPNSLLQLNPANGAASIIGSTGLPLIVEGDLAFNPTNGFLYGLQDLGQSVTHRYFFRIDPTNGSTTIISDLPLSGDYSALAFDSVGTLYAVDTSNNGNSILTKINASTGAVISTTSMNVNLGSQAGLAIDPASGIGYVADGGDSVSNPTGMLFSLNMATGVATAIGPLGIPEGLSGLTIVSVPEPSSLVLAATVGSIFAPTFLRRRLRRSALPQ